MKKELAAIPANNPLVVIRSMLSLIHILGTYMRTQKEIALLSDEQKGVISQIGTTAQGSIQAVSYTHLPFKVVTCASMFQTYWRPWDASMHAHWVRPDVYKRQGRIIGSSINICFHINHILNVLHNAMSQ